MESTHTLSSSQSLSESPDGRTYAIIVRGEEFRLTHEQISSDAPNYFTDCFSESSGFQEAKDRVVRLDRNPALFALIVEYLSGYPILPLTADSLPPGMGLTMANRCLLADAQYYNLGQLCLLLTQPRMPTPRTDLTWSGLANEVVSLHDVLAPRLPEGVIRKENGNIVSVRSGLPVLVVADNVLLRISRTDLGSPSFSIIVSPSSNPAAHAHEQSASRDESLPALHADGFEHDALFVMDGTPYPFTRISAGFHRLFHPYNSSSYYAIDAAVSNLLSHLGIPGDTTQQPTSYTFWADTIYCIFLPGGAAARVVIVRANVRSRQSLLHDMDASRIDVEGAGPSRHVATAANTTMGSMLDLFVIWDGRIPVSGG
ncbi:hypothetical protein C8Q80DRAFT_906167 [Daedaleopsis nitida]|nr:hypothetical protein C8Q80DRAFT_906167 [Daedaleopsis nitida]